MFRLFFRCRWSRPSWQHWCSFLGLSLSLLKTQIRRRLEGVTGPYCYSLSLHCCPAYSSLSDWSRCFDFDTELLAKLTDSSKSLARLVPFCWDKYSRCCFYWRLSSSIASYLNTKSGSCVHQRRLEPCLQCRPGSMASHPELTDSHSRMIDLWFGPLFGNLPSPWLINVQKMYLPDSPDLLESFDSITARHSRSIPSSYWSQSYYLSAVASASSRPVFTPGIAARPSVWLRLICRGRSTCWSLHLTSGWCWGPACLGFGLYCFLGSVIWIFARSWAAIASNLLASLRSRSLWERRTCPGWLRCYSTVLLAWGSGWSWLSLWRPVYQRRPDVTHSGVISRAGACLSWTYQRPSFGLYSSHTS